MDRKDWELKEIEKRNLAKKQKLESLQADITALRIRFAERKSAIQDISKEIEEKGGVEQVKLQKEVESLRVILLLLRQRLAHIRMRLAVFRRGGSSSP